MPFNDFDFILLFGALGIVCGMWTAVALREARHPFFWTVASAFLSANLLGIGGTFTLITIKFLSTSYSFWQCLIMGAVSGQGFFAMVPGWSGVPAVLAGLAAQWLLQRGRGQRHPVEPSPAADGQRDG